MHLRNTFAMHKINKNENKKKTQHLRSIFTRGHGKMAIVCAYVLEHSHPFCKSGFVRHLEMHSRIDREPYVRDVLSISLSMHIFSYYFLFFMCSAHVSSSQKSLHWNLVPDTHWKSLILMFIGLV